MASILHRMKRFVKGIILKGETSDSSENVEGALFHNSSDSRIKSYIQGAVREIVTNSQSQVLSNKTIIVSSNTITTAAHNTLTATELNAALAQLQDHIDAFSGASQTIFDTTITIGTSASTATGLLHYKAPSNLTLISATAQLFEKNGVSSGTLEVDVKKNTTPDDVGMTTIFSAKPSFDFASISDYATSNGTISVTSISAGNYLRLDLTNIPAGFVGHIQVILIGVI